MIEINNLTTSTVDEGFLKEVAEVILKEENKKRGRISLALVGSVRIREINKKYRKKNRITDVLAFPESKVLLNKFKADPLQQFLGLGEIVICLKEVRKNAKEFKSTYEKELARVLIHGILHLLGYNHEKDKQKAEIMRKKEEYYLFQLNF